MLSEIATLFLVGYLAVSGSLITAFSFVVLVRSFSKRK